jgi:hypothetical protein
MNYNQHGETSIREFGEPPSPAERTNTVRSPISTLQQHLGPLDHFIAAVDSSARASASPLDDGAPSGGWMSALIQMQVASFAEVWHSTSMQDDPLAAMSLLYSSLGSSRRAIMRLEERIPDIRRSDYAMELSRLEQLLEEVRSGKTQLEEQLNNRFRLSSLQEARNAVSCESESPLRSLK